LYDIDFKPHGRLLKNSLVINKLVDNIVYCYFKLVEIFTAAVQFAREIIRKHFETVSTLFRSCKPIIQCICVPIYYLPSWLPIIYLSGQVIYIITSYY